MLKKLPTKAKVKKALSSCFLHAAPATDSITAHFYQKHWDLLGTNLTEFITAILQDHKPYPSQRTSMVVFGKKPGKKSKSLLILDRRKLMLLHVDSKLMTGVEPARIKSTMSRTISPLQLILGGEKQVTHGIAMACDANTASGLSKARCYIIDTDIIAEIM